MHISSELKKLMPKNFLLLTIAGFINAFGVTIFLAPVKLYDSGVSGTSMLLAQITPEWMSLSVFLLLLNIPLFFYGLRKQGIQFTIYAIYTVAMYSLGAWLITDVLPVDVSIASPLAGTDLLLCALFGGMISGLGSGLAIRFGGAMDGIEVMAVIFAKRLGLTVGSFVMVYNVFLYVVCGIVIHSWILPLYSIVTYMAALKTVDFIVEGIDRSKAVMIVTVRQKQVCAALSETFEEGMTIMDAKGYFSDSDKKMIYIVLNRFQIIRMKELVHNIDPSAYITISEVADIFKSNQVADVEKSRGRWIFFDVGSTLVDESHAYEQRNREMIQGTDITYEQFREKELFYASQGRNGIEEARLYFKLTKTPWPNELEAPYPDAEALLQYVKHLGYHIGIIANQTPGTEERLRRWGLLSYIDVVAASAELGVSKPDAEIFRRAFAMAGCEARDSIMVGDRLDNDIYPAKQLGMKTIWVRQGQAAYQKEETIAADCQPDYAVKNLTELMEQRILPF